MERSVGGYMYLQLKKQVNNVKEIYLMIALVLLSGIIRFYWVYSFTLQNGILYTGDTERYDLWARQILSQGIGYYADNIDKPYYWGYASVIALFRLIFVSDKALIIFQTLLSTLIVIAVYKISVMIFNDKTIAFMSGIMYCYCYPIIDYNGLLYSDSLGLSLEVICLYLFFLAKKKSGGKKMLTLCLFFITAVMFLLIRTTAFITVIVLVIELINQLSAKRRKIVYATLSVLIISMIAYMFLHSSGEHSPASRLEYYIGLFKNGTIVYTGLRIEILPEIYDSWLFIFCIIGIILLRAVCFWGFALPYMGIGEMIANTLLLLPLFVIGIGGIVKGMKIKDRNCCTLAAIIIFTNIVQACSEVDSNFRYRMPIYPLLMLLGGFFIDSLLIKKSQNPESIAEQ